jgi:hypothetical protein
MEIIKVLSLITIMSINSNELVQEYSYVKHTPIIYFGEDTLTHKKDEDMGNVLTRITIKHELEDMDCIIIYPDSIIYTIRK